MDRPDEILIAYVVACDTREQARHIGRTLVEEGLAACIHLRPTVGRLFAPGWRAGRFHDYLAARKRKARGWRTPGLRSRCGESARPFPG
jgi:hypothetical protein